MLIFVCVDPAMEYSLRIAMNENSPEDLFVSCLRRYLVYTPFPLTISLLLEIDGICLEYSHSHYFQNYASSMRYGGASASKLLIWLGIRIPEQCKYWLRPSLSVTFYIPKLAFDIASDAVIANGSDTRIVVLFFISMC